MSVAEKCLRKKLSTEGETHDDGGADAWLVGYSRQ